MATAFFKHHHNGTIEIPVPIPDRQHGVAHIGKFGHSVLWTVTIAMGVSTVIFLLAGARAATKRSLFHRITALITFTAFVSYYVMATGGGKAIVRAPGPDGHRAFREVFYARDIDWLITTPLLLLDLTLLASIPPIDIISIVIADVAMIVLGLFAGLDAGLKTRWIPFTASCLAFLFVVFKLLIQGRKTATSKSAHVGALFTSISLFSMVVWTAYPIVFALAEGTNVLKSDTEVLAYAILDVLAKPVFGFWLLAAHATIDDNDTFLIPSSWTSPLGNYGSVQLED